ncbi:GNAT family N-acetyltransferase [Devosia submarina]|uniref:GNAT family N-acetyltransferase n=1 Tax=Devosia submarina TaxID=1173082 RepID=UPI001FEB3FB3|nr:GNAT family N-acetyltransferase [Devosia submarina]
MPLYPTYPLQTERLTLRPFTRGDVDGVFAYRQLEEVARFLFDHPLSREECALAVQQRITQTGLAEADDKIILAVELTGTGALIGEVSLIWRSVEARQGELGWIFHPQYQKQGFATEAANFMLDLAFGPGDMHRVCARCDVRNERSWRLMERLGMRREAHFREHAIFKGSWDEEFIYAILWQEWHQSRTQKLQSP